MLLTVLYVPDISIYCGLQIKQACGISIGISHLKDVKLPHRLKGMLG
jgi:hypothetical protein